jgi:hypothetical protein
MKKIIHSLRIKEFKLIFPFFIILTIAFTILIVPILPA